MNLEQAKSILFARWETPADLRRDFPGLAPLIRGERFAEDYNGPLMGINGYGVGLSRTILQSGNPKPPRVGILSPGEFLHKKRDNQVEDFTVLESGKGDIDFEIGIWFPSPEGSPLTQVSSRLGQFGTATIPAGRECRIDNVYSNPSYFFYLTRFALG